MAKEPTTSTPNGSGDASSVYQKYSGITRLRDFMRDKRLDLTMYVTRIATLLFALYYVVPIFGNAQQAYRRAHMACLATSAMRLFQRLRGSDSPVMLSKEFMAHLITEDSFHYLIYSLMFFFFGPVSFTLLPVFMFAALHVANFTRQMLETTRGTPVKDQGLESILTLFSARTPWILKMAATAEVCLMGLILINCFRGKLSFVAVFLYYRFLYLRFASKRNHYTRLVFSQLRNSAERAIATPGCPAIIGRVVTTCIAIIIRISPPITPCPCRQH